MARSSFWKRSSTLGNNAVRCVAMDATDGLARGVKAFNTGAPITVPVGPATLGRMFNVLGDPIDGKGEVNATNALPYPPPGPVVRRAIHSGRGARDRHQGH